MLKRNENTNSFSGGTAQKFENLSKCEHAGCGQDTWGIRLMWNDTCRKGLPVVIWSPRSDIDARWTQGRRKWAQCSNIIDEHDVLLLYHFYSCHPVPLALNRMWHILIGSSVPEGCISASLLLLLTPYIPKSVSDQHMVAAAQAPWGAAVTPSVFISRTQSKALN